jgi:uncharacterized ferritin-like protein (DUF455 family)
VVAMRSLTPRPRQMPSHKEAGVSLPVYLLQGLAHIEFNAMHLYLYVFAAAVSAVVCGTAVYFPRAGGRGATT